MSKGKQRLDLDELRKSLEGLDFTPEEIQEVLEKAEKENQLLGEPDIEKGEGKSDKDVADPKELEKEEMEKAYTEIMSKQEELKKAVSDYFDKFGNIPGFKTPTDFFTEKSVSPDIEKSFGEKTDMLEKAFSGRIDVIEKSLDLFNKSIDSKLDLIQKSVNEIATTPNPLKGLFGSYQNRVVDKGENGDGSTVINLNNRRASLDVFQKSLDKLQNEEDKNAVRDLISDYTISKVVNDKALNIVKKALNIDFEK